MQSQQQANYYLLFATIIWGITPIVVEELLNYMSPFLIMTIRFGLAFVILTVYILLFHRQEGFNLIFSKNCILIGLLNAFAYPISAIGVELTTAGIATLLSTSFVIIVPFIAWVIEGKELNIEIILIALIALCGLFLISYNGDWNNFSNSTSLGIIMSILAAVLWGFSIVLSSRLLDITDNKNNNNSALSFIFSINFYTFFPLLLFTLFTSENLSFSHLRLVQFLIFLGIFPTIIAFGLYTWAIARIGSVNTSFFLLLQVLVPLFFEFLFMQRHYSIWIYIGTTLILLSMFFINKSNRPTKREEFRKNMVKINVKS
ncbi:MAG: DMT family transporter [Candidatus Hodarchaeales archaeon]|jgi:drug/metabolite transporter (DMT)-like permease